jgi:hypothetical protein
MCRMTTRGWDVRSSHLFRIFEDEEEETEALSARLLVQTTVSGEAEDNFRFKIHGAVLHPAGGDEVTTGPGSKRLENR